MEPRKSVFFILVAALLAISIFVTLSEATQTQQTNHHLDKPRTKFAWASFLYGSFYFNPLRVMIKSLQRSGTKNDIIVLVTKDVPLDYRNILREDGARVHEVPYIENPYSKDRVFQQRFQAVMAKLNLWNQTQYEKLVYLDADTMTIENSDELFACGDFCAAFINPCIFNSGVMVLKPSAETLDDMMKSLATKRSYDGADQGFLNAYFSDMLKAPLFDPKEIPAEELENPKTTGFYRLPTIYHVDHFLFYQRSKWDMPCLKPKILEFMGPAFLKPWNWWSYLFLELSWEWLAVKNTLPSDGGDDFIFVMLLAITFFFGALVWKMLIKSPMRSKIAKYLQRNHSSSSTDGLSVTVNPNAPTESAQIIQSLIAGFLLFFACGYIAFQMIPANLYPIYAWVVMIAWTQVMSLFLFYCYCCCYFIPASSAAPDWSQLLQHPNLVSTAVLRKTLFYSLVPFHLLLLLCMIFKSAGIVFLFSKVAFLIVGVFLELFALFIVFGAIASLWIHTFGTNYNAFAMISDSKSFA